MDYNTKIGNNWLAKSINKKFVMDAKLLVIVVHIIVYRHIFILIFFPTLYWNYLELKILEVKNQQNEQKSINDIFKSFSVAKLWLVLLIIFIPAYNFI